MIGAIVVLSDRCDELVAALGKGLYESGSFRAIAERPTNLEDVTPEHFRLHVGIGPHGPEQLVVRHEMPRVFDQMSENRERLRHQRDPRLPSP